LNCGGGQHNNQCQNVTKAVQGKYDVEYMETEDLAWSGGEICRDVKELCPGMEGPLKVTGDFAAAGLASTAIGLTSLLTFQFMKNKEQVMVLLQVSLGGFCLAFVLLFVSWVYFLGVQGEKASCIVEAESGTGAVKAHGRFSDIFSTGAYALPFVIGSWMLLAIPMLLILIRMQSKGNSETQAESGSGDDSKEESYITI